MIDNIGIVDTKKIITAVQESFGLDLSDYSNTILRRRLIYIINLYNCPSIDDFVEKITKNNITLDEFNSELMVEATELLRDPSLWRELRERYLPEISRSPGSKIWMPGITSGDELFSLGITLKESGIGNALRVVASCPAQRRIDQIKQGGNYDIKKMELGEANYSRFSGKVPFTDYYHTVGSRGQMDLALIDGMEIDKTNICQDEVNKVYRMVIYRNMLLQYNLPLYEKVVRKLIDSLVVGGYLIIGNMETLEYSEVGKKMQLINESEKIYRKRID